MKFTETTLNERWMSKCKRFEIHRFQNTYRNGGAVPCEPYFVAYRARDGKKIYGDAPTFERAVQACKDTLKQN